MRKYLPMLPFNQTLPQFDLPIDFLGGDEYFETILEYYSKFPCKIKSFIFVLCKEGEIDATINHTEYTIKAGQFVTLLPETFVQTHKVKGKVRLSFIGFSSSFVETNILSTNYISLLPLFREKAALPLTQEKLYFYDNLFRLLSEAKATNELPLTNHILKKFLEILLEQLSELYKLEFHPELNKLSRRNEIFIEFMQLLYDNYKTEHSISFYAKETNITQQHFCKTIKEVSGKTPSEIITRLLITDAKSNLKTTGSSVKEIAFSLGFKSLSFFYRFFKKHTGLTPQEYREKE